MEKWRKADWTEWRAQRLASKCLLLAWSVVFYMFADCVVSVWSSLHTHHFDVYLHVDLPVRCPWPCFERVVSDVSSSLSSMLSYLWCCCHGLSLSFVIVRAHSSMTLRSVSLAAFSSFVHVFQCLMSWEPVTRAKGDLQRNLPKNIFWPRKKNSFQNYKFSKFEGLFQLAFAINCPIDTSTRAAQTEVDLGCTKHDSLMVMQIRCLFMLLNTWWLCPSRQTRLRIAIIIKLHTSVCMWTCLCCSRCCYRRCPWCPRPGSGWANEDCQWSSGLQQAASVG